MAAAAMRIRTATAGNVVVEFLFPSSQASLIPPSKISFQIKYFPEESTSLRQPRVAKMSIQPAIFSAHQTIDGIQTIPAVQNPGNAATSGTNQNAVVDPAAQNPVTQNSGAIPGTSTIQSPTSTANFNTGQSATANPPISSSSSSIPTQNVNASQTTSGVQNSGTPQPASTVHGHTRIQSRISIQNLATNTGPTIHGDYESKILSTSILIPNFQEIQRVNKPILRQRQVTEAS